MRHALFTVLITLLAGCVHTSGPRQATGFSNIMSLDQLEGTYRDLGVSGPGMPELRLSDLIWPTKGFTDEPDRIEVRVVSQDTLRVRALRTDGMAMQDSLFLKGRDFEISGGKIVLSSRFEVFGGRPQSPALGFITDRRVLGLDAKGHDAYRQSGYGAGLVLLLFPFAVYEANKVRFERLSE